MNVVTTVGDLRKVRPGLTKPVGFVPTMGFLHDGHAALIAESKRTNASTIASIFVNPKQFGPREDYSTYPRDLGHDLRLLEGANVDLAFIPTVEEIYPPGFSLTVDVGPIGERLEGHSRPGHFRGVATVVTRLFGLVHPDRAYFGQKDGQQCVVVKKLMRELGLPVQVVIVPTVREGDGLALSSRNVYLDPEERVAARILSAALARAREAFDVGEHDCSKLRSLVSETIGTERRVVPDYVSVADPDSLDELNEVDRAGLLLVAAVVGTTRLIDNEFLGSIDEFDDWLGATQPA